MSDINTKSLIKQAMLLAEKGKYSCSPNPMVGAIILSNGEITGEGWHHRAGDPHAEINALRNAGNNSAGATLIVTLEPCCTYGRTPPCTKSIIDAGIKRVIIGAIDPNPSHSGKGIEILKNAGIEVELLNDPECEKLNEKYNWFISNKTPFVHVKWAMTMDGKIATRTGDSKWISCEQSRELVHKLRAEYDAVMVGSGTVLTDNPKLNVRLDGEWKQPVKILIDSLCRTPVDSEAVNLGNVIIACGQDAPPEKVTALEASGVKIINAKYNDNGKVNIKILLKSLADMGITSIFVEGGGSLTGSLFDEQLVNKFTVFISPKIIGGKDSITPVGGEGIEKISQALMPDNLKFEKIGCDFVITGNLPC